MVESLMLLGALGLIAGAFAFCFVTRVSRGAKAPKWFRSLRLLALIVGAVSGLATWPLTYAMGYAIGTPHGPGRVVGVPFIVAFFDSSGFDYVGGLSFLSLSGNIAFWFLAPQFVLAAIGFRWRKQVASRQITVTQ